MLGFRPCCLSTTSSSRVCVGEGGLLVFPLRIRSCDVPGLSPRFPSSIHHLFITNKGRLSCIASLKRIPSLWLCYCYTEISQITMGVLFQRGNDALNINPPVGSEVLSVHGSDWLWAVTAVFALSFVRYLFPSDITYLEVNQGFTQIHEVLTPDHSWQSGD